MDAFIPAPLRSGNYVRTSLRTPTLHSACIYASTSAPHGISSSILSLHMFRSFSRYPCHYPPISSCCLHSCGVSTPKELNPLNFDNDFILYTTNFFVFIVSMSTKNKFNKYNKDFFEYNIYRQKNKKSSKDKAASTDPRFGQ